MGWQQRSKQIERHDRIAIVGTAPSWKDTPWTDIGLQVWSLNDAYRLPGFVRADRWYDFHPLDKFYHPQAGAAGVYAHHVPAGHYVRPAEHLAWLAQQTIPIYLHPDYQTQHPAAATWSHAHPFPKGAIETAFGRYFTSSPAWMMAHAILEGVKELHIYGIHLSTEHEYIEQRPGFEYLIGRVLGAKRLTTTVKQGLRYYETADGLVVLPEASPILQADFQYAFQPRPRQALEPLKWELHKLQVKQTRVAKALTHRSPFVPWVTFTEPARDPSQPPRLRRASTSTLLAELARLEAETADVHEQMARLHGGWS